MVRKFAFAAVLASACFFVAGCEDDADMSALGNSETAVTEVAAAETKADCAATCAEKKACAATCGDKGEVAAAETKAKTGCCAKKAAGAAQDN